MKLKSVLLTLTIVGKFVYAVPSENDFKICDIVYSKCIEQQQLKKIRKVCVQFEDNFPEVIGYLNLYYSGLIKSNEIGSGKLELAINQCSMKRAMFKVNEHLSQVPDSNFESGVNPHKYIVEE